MRPTSRSRREYQTPLKDAPAGVLHARTLPESVLEMQAEVGKTPEMVRADFRSNKWGNLRKGLETRWRFAFPS